MEKITKESIERAIKELGINPFVEHYKWEEDGQKYSAWKVFIGKSMFMTGDGGIEMFNKALKDRLNG